MSESVTSRYIEAADDGAELPVNDLEKTYGYTGSSLTTVTVVFNDNTYTKTYTYTDGNLTGASQWELQEA